VALLAWLEQLADARPSRYLARRDEKRLAVRRIEGATAEWGLECPPFGASRFGERVQAVLAAARSGWEFAGARAVQPAISLCILLSPSMSRKRQEGPMQATRIRVGHIGWDDQDFCGHRAFRGTGMRAVLYSSARHLPMNALLLHVPKGFSSDDWRHNYINIMPMGVFSIAHFARARGHDVKVMNAAVYRDRDAAFRLILRRIAEGDIRVIGMPIHWHLSAHDVCAVATRIKTEVPNCRIVFGGNTASVFAEEFLQACAAADGVIRGDGELPFAAYLDEIAQRARTQDLSNVPNLCWRRGGIPTTNHDVYVAARDELSSFDFSPTDVLPDIAEYANGPGMLEAMRGKPFDLIGERIEDRCFFLNVGRGCSLSCVYCAGSRVSFARYFHRGEVAYRSIDAVLETVRRAAGAGFRKLHVCFDAPRDGKDDYFASLFARIRQEVPHDMSMFFETYDLPTTRFLEAMSASFREAVAIVSPCFFDPERMRRYKGYRFTREEMERTLRTIGEYPNLKAFVYFAITPLERWDEAAIVERAGYMRYLARAYGCRASAMPILAEPGSPWVAFPELFGEPSIPLSFADFWDEWRKPLDRWSEKLCHLPGVNRIVARLDELTENPSLTAESLS
jgi:hypothetical protein